MATNLGVISTKGAMRPRGGINTPFPDRSDPLIDSHNKSGYTMYIREWRCR